MRPSVPGGDLAAIIEQAVTEKLERLESRRFARTEAPRKKLSQSRHDSPPRAGSLLRSGAPCATGTGAAAATGTPRASGARPETARVPPPAPIGCGGGHSRGDRPPARPTMVTWPRSTTAGRPSRGIGGRAPRARVTGQPERRAAGPRVGKPEARRESPELSPAAVTGAARLHRAPDTAGNRQGDPRFHAGRESGRRYQSQQKVRERTRHGKTEAEQRPRGAARAGTSWALRPLVATGSRRIRNSRPRVSVPNAHLPGEPDLLGGVDPFREAPHRLEGLAEAEHERPGGQPASAGEPFQRRIARSSSPAETRSMGDRGAATAGTARGEGVQGLGEQRGRHQRVGVDEDEEPAAGRPRARVAGPGDLVDRLEHHRAPRVPGGLGGAVGRVVVAHDELAAERRAPPAPRARRRVSRAGAPPRCRPGGRWSSLVAASQRQDSRNGGEMPKASSRPGLPRKSRATSGPGEEPRGGRRGPEPALDMSPGPYIARWTAPPARRSRTRSSPRAPGPRLPRPAPRRDRRPVPGEPAHPAHRERGPGEARASGSQPRRQAATGAGGDLTGQSGGRPRAAAPARGRRARLRLPVPGADPPLRAGGEGARRELQKEARAQLRRRATPRLRVLLTGATGFLGQGDPGPGRRRPQSRRWWRWCARRRSGTPRRRRS